MHSSNNTEWVRTQQSCNRSDLQSSLNPQQPSGQTSMMAPPMWLAEIDAYSASSTLIGSSGMSTAVSFVYASDVVLIIPAAESETATINNNNLLLCWRVASSTITKSELRRTWSLSGPNHDTPFGNGANLFENWRRRGMNGNACTHLVTHTHTHNVNVNKLIISRRTPD